MYELCGPPSLKNLEFQNSFPASGGSTEWAMNDAHCWQADRRRRSSYSNFQEAGGLRIRGGSQGEDPGPGPGAASLTGSV